MPYVNIKITREGATAAQKAELIAGATELLREVLGKSPATTVVVLLVVGLVGLWRILPALELKLRSHAGPDGRVILVLDPAYPSKRTPFL